jgi:PKD repeat protein
MNRIFAFTLSVVLPMLTQAAPNCSGVLNILGGASEINDTVYTCVHTEITFEDLSLLEGALVGRDWNFGDGNSETNVLVSNVTVHTYDTEGIYTVSLTVTSVVCPSITIERTIIVLGEPSHVASAQQVDCFGNCTGSASIFFDSPNTDRYFVQWNDPDLQIEQTAVGLCGGSYTAMVFDQYGCTDITIPDIFVFEPDLFEAFIDLPDTFNICPADGHIGVSLNFNGGTPSYTSFWESSVYMTPLAPENADFAPFPDALNTMYRVTIVDGAGCSVQDSVYMRATPSTLVGNVSFDDDDACENCALFMYHYDVDPGLWAIIGSTFTDVAGDYDLGVIPNFEDFVILADPDPANYPMASPAYHPDVHHWEDATVLTNVCGLDLHKDITLVSPLNFNGTSTFTGTVWYNPNGKTQTEEDPIPLIDVVVEKTPPGQPQGRVTTGVNGGYTFDFVPNSDTTYTLFVNMPGVPVVTTYEILVDQQGQTFDNLDFCLNMDSTEIDICQVGQPVVVPSPVEEPSDHVSVYPNPNAGRFTIETGDFATETCEISVIDMAGRAVFRKTYVSTPNFVNLVNIPMGNYLVRLYNEGRMHNTKVAVTND